MVNATSINAYSPSGPGVGVIPTPYVNSLDGNSYKYTSSAGGKKRKYHNKSTYKKTKKARKNRVSRRTRYNR